jgi:hypothetical protein
MATQKSSDSSQKLKKGEGFPHEIIGSALECEHLILYPVSCRQDQDRQTRLEWPNALEQADSVKFREIEVQDQKIITASILENVECRFAIVNEIHGERLRLQFPPKEAGQGGVLFDN